MNRQNNIPPKYAHKLLLWFLREDMAEEVEGDLEEQFNYKLNNSSLRKANLDYWYQVLNYLRLFAIKNIIKSNTNHLDMFQNYFKIGWRNLTKQKLYSGIKIGGLAFSIATCLLISLFIRRELSYDTYYPNGDCIFRIVGNYNIEGKTVSNTYFPAVMAAVLENEFPEIETAGHFLGNEILGRGTQMVRRPEEARNIYEDGFVYMNQKLIKILKPHFIKGDSATVLMEPNTLAISKSTAEKYFPNENPLGKTLVLNNDAQNPYIVRGVFEDFPSTTHFNFDFLVTLTGTESFTGDHTTWRRNIFHTYVKIKPETDKNQLETKLKEVILIKYMMPAWQQSGIATAKKLAEEASLTLQPISDIHLLSSEIHDGLTHGNIRFIWLFGAIALFILVIACINFINLSTAKSANRAKEVGLRKVVGSLRFDLVKQFLVESVLVSFISFALAFLLSWLLLPYFNELSGKELDFPWNDWKLLSLLAACSILVGLLAGIYPSFYLSRFQPIQVLKGGVSRGSKSSRLRSGLVIFQFSTSIILIVGTFIIYQQLGFILKKDVGFNKDQVLMVKGTTNLADQLPAFKNELQKLANVQEVTVTDYLPLAEGKRNGASFWKKGRQDLDSPLNGQMWVVDEDYIQTMGLNLKVGRNFNINIASDKQALIINQTMAKGLNLENPVGAEIVVGDETFEVIGIVEDFNYESLTEKIKPLSLIIGKSSWAGYPSVVSVKVNAANVSEVIEEVSSVWNQFSPNETFQYSFMDESFARMYDNVQRMGRIFTSFAVLAIMIACLGLFALSAFMIEQRSKEVGVRLVLGASLQNIIFLLTQNFLMLVFISFIIATPIAWYLMQRWLEDFAYRIEIGWDIFLLAGLMAGGIAVLTISYQSIKAALMNPVKTLRSE